MPEISTFYGITIRMFNKDHQLPHFHAEYGGKMESIDIRTGRVLVGNLPKEPIRWLWNGGRYTETNCWKCGKPNN